MQRSKQEVFMNGDENINYTFPQEMGIASLNHEIVSPSVSDLQLSDVQLIILTTLRSYPLYR
jgi:hypothetical protein